MEMRDSMILSSCDDEDEVVGKAKTTDVEEGEYFLVSDIPENTEKEEIQVINEEEENPSIPEMCRICATVNSHTIPIFKGEGLEHDLCSKINKHLPIKVTEKDILPLKLCYHCAATLIAWNDLSEGCLEAQNQLLRLQAERVPSADEEARPEQLEVTENFKEEYVEENRQKDLIDLKNAEDSDSERSSRVQTSFKVFLDTQNIFRMPLKSTITDKISDLQIPIDEEQPVDVKADVKPEQGEEYQEFQLDSEVANSDSEEFHWKCKVCNEEFNSAIELNDHAKRHNSKETYRCRECGRCFKLKDSYIRHARIHKDERPFTCHVCGKQFRDSGGLSRHLKDVHAKVKNFPCDLCESSFASKATRDDHRRTHTGERPYICDCCGKTFKSKASLYIHSKLHTDEFPHPCSYCTKKFRRKQEMLAHVTTHTGEKNFACDICHKRFRVKSELMRHRLIHSENKPFACTKCGLAFRQKRYLNNHVKSRHVESLRNC